MTQRSRRARKAPAVGRWSAEAGLYPYKVIVEENPHRKGGLYLRWWLTDLDNWKRESLGNLKKGKVLRTADGEINQEVATWAVEEAMRKSRELSGSLAPAGEKSKRFTIGQIEAAITDKDTGKYPNRSPFRDELVRAVRFAETVWGKDTPADSIDEDQWTKLIRKRLEGLIERGNTGIAASATTVSRLITVFGWLRKKKLIPIGAGQIDEDWKADLLAHRRGLTGSKRDPEPYQPRHTLDEMRKIVRAAPFVDPRMAILLYVTAELRLGQTSRALRSDLKLEKSEFGELRIHGSGHKGGEIVELTRGMRIAIDAYLSGFLTSLEEEYRTSGKDYPLFPAGRIFGRKHGTGHRFGKKMRADQYVSRMWIRTTFRAVEKKAGVPYVKGRGAYGLRRTPVDLALEQQLGDQGLKALGGWSSTAVPKGIYAEQENRIGRRAARDFKAGLRGEGDAVPADEGPETPAEAFAKVDAANERVTADIAAGALHDEIQAGSKATNEAIRALIGEETPSSEGGSNEG